MPWQRDSFALNGLLIAAVRHVQGRQCVAQIVIAGVGIPAPHPDLGPSAKLRMV